MGKLSQKRYWAEGHKEKNSQKKASKLIKFLEYCKTKWLKPRTPRGTKRRLRRAGKLKK